MTAIKSLKQDFHTEIGGVLAAIKEIQTDLKECSGRLTQAEEHISTAEDTLTRLQTKVHKLEAKVKSLATKRDDLECRSWRNNMRIVGIPEKEEGLDPCAFMEKWIPEILNIQPPPVIERDHRIAGQMRNVTSPRTFIVKFLNYKTRNAFQEQLEQRARCCTKQPNQISPRPISRSLQATERL